MKAKPAIFLVVLFTAGIFLMVILLMRSPESLAGKEAIPKIGETAVTAPDARVFFKHREPAVADVPSDPNSTTAAASPGQEARDHETVRDQRPPASFPEEITVHVSADFRLGDLSNLVSDADVLRMGDGQGFGPRGAPQGQRFGLYISPEQEANQSFDEVIAQSEAVVPEGSELAFEFRTRTAGGNWSVWQRIAPNEMSQPVEVGAPADAWQYRLTFFADDPSLGPQVGSVAFATRPVAPQATATRSPGTSAGINH